MNEAIRQVGDDNHSAGAHLLSDPDQDDEDDEDDDLDGFDIHGQYVESTDDEDEDDDFGDDIYDDDSEAEFIASLGLELTGMLEKCSKCSTGLPTDAPYCYSCLAPHFYEVD